MVHGDVNPRNWPTPTDTRVHVHGHVIECVTLFEPPYNLRLQMLSKYRLATVVRPKARLRGRGPNNIMRVL